MNSLVHTRTNERAKWRGISPLTRGPLPAQVKDTKTALRFMKQNAATYHADPNKIIMWGDSSGGHTAVMVGVSLNEAALDDESPTAEFYQLKGADHGGSAFWTKNVLDIVEQFVRKQL